MMASWVNMLARPQLVRRLRLSGVSATMCSSGDMKVQIIGDSAWPKVCVITGPNTETASASFVADIGAAA